MTHNTLSFERQVLRALRPHVTPGSRLLLAVSGGLDSMVLAEVLRRVQRVLKVQFAIGHVHHGSLTGTAKQKRFRKSAQKHVREWAEAHHIEFLTNARGGSAKSEAALRDMRLKHLNHWRKKGFQALLFAHHQDDLLETRVIRLIRGTGRQGLQSMSEESADVLRPLLGVSRAQILKYAEARGLKWCEDPSNNELDPLRNWLRHEWLPQLEKKRAGALNALARSLENLVAEEGNSEPVGECVALRRDLLSGVTLRQQREMVARYLRALGLSGYGHSHVDEILKRLQTATNKSVEFEMLRLKFHISPDFLWASRV